VSFAEADDLFAEGDVHESERVAGGRMGCAVVGGVDGGERIVLREILVEARGAKSSRMCCTGLVKASAMPLACHQRSEVPDR